MLSPAARAIVVLPGTRPREHIMIQETSAPDLTGKQTEATFAADWSTLGPGEGARPGG